MEEFIQDINTLYALEKPLVLNEIGESHYVNTVFRCPNNNIAVKKYAKYRFNQEDIYMSCLAQYRMSKVGLSPEILLNKDGWLFSPSSSGELFAVFKWIPGKPLSPYDNLHDIETWGRYLGKIHKELLSIRNELNSKPSLFVLPNIDTKIKEFKSLLQAKLRQELLGQYELFTKHYSKDKLINRHDQVIHGDMRIGNVIRSVDGVDMLIDYDQVSIYPAVYELIRFFLSMVPLNPLDVFLQRFSKYVEGYRNVFPLDQFELEMSFEFYYINLLSNLRNFEERFILPSSNQMIRERYYRMLWFDENIDKINNFIKSNM